MLTAEDIEAIRVGYTPEKRFDLTRLCDLALRGLATRKRPIEEAPKDGSPVLLLRGGHGWKQGYWSTVFDCWFIQGIGFISGGPPTHFIPLKSLGE